MAHFSNTRSGAFMNERLRTTASSWARRGFFLIRGILFLGRKHRCPCCGWRLRAFVGERSIIGQSATGYCPRCNAKARHRRDWIFLQERTDLFAGSKRLLEIAPWWSLSRLFQKIPSLEFFSVDLKKTGPHVTTIGDVVRLPFANASFDVVICIHVLEHVIDDKQAIDELFRVLKPGAWALISVPLLLDRPTREDPSITDPNDRQRLFGEPTHIRFYGTDLADRLKSAGFEVTLDLAERIPLDKRHLFALRDDENIFYCQKSSNEMAKQEGSTFADRPQASAGTL
jgi:hypothetical protein